MGRALANPTTLPFFSLKGITMYQSGVPTSWANMLQSLAAFASANGWTIDLSASGAGYDWRVSLHKGTCFLSFYSVAGSNQMRVNGATSFTGAATPELEPDALAVTTITDALIGPYVGYHFFTSSTSAAYLHVVVEVTAGVFRHIHGGQLNQIGGAAPCIYTAATQWVTTGRFPGYPDFGNQNYIPFSAQSTNTSLLCEVDGTLQWFTATGVSPKRLNANPGQTNGLQNRGEQRSPNTFNGLATLLGIGLFPERAVGNIYSYVGNVLDMAWVNIANVNAKDEVAIGGDTWKYFPACAKGPTSNIDFSPQSSGNYGFALRKNG
jgi:hypothetical protein